MFKLREEEMKNVVGGTDIGSALLNAVSKVIETIYNLGDALGSSLRRLIEDKKCNL